MSPHCAATAVFVINLFVTSIMCGALWLTQLSYYPLLGFVHRLGEDVFLEAERAHIRHVSAIAWTMLTVELATALLLVRFRPATMSVTTAWIGVALIVAIWVMTIALQNRYHKALSVRFDAEIHYKLLWTNWLRVASWTARVALLLSVVVRAM